MLKPGELAIGFETDAACGLTLSVEHIVVRAIDFREE